MINTTIFNEFIAQIEEFNLRKQGNTIDEILLMCDEIDIENIMSSSDAYVFLIYEYILHKTHKIENKNHIYDVMFEYTKNNKWLLNEYSDYLIDNKSDMSIEQYINDIFLKMDVDGEKKIKDAYTGNDGYCVSHATYFMLNKIINLLKNFINGTSLVDAVKIHTDNPTQNDFDCVEGRLTFVDMKDKTKIGINTILLKKPFNNHCVFNTFVNYLAENFNEIWYYGSDGGLKTGCSLITTKIGGIYFTRLNGPIFYWIKNPSENSEYKYDHEEAERIAKIFLKLKRCMHFDEKCDNNLQLFFQKEYNNNTNLYNQYLL